MKQILISLFVGSLVAVFPAGAQTVLIEHSSVAETASPPLQFLTPILQSDSHSDVSGYYQGQFDLWSVGAFSSFSCSAADAYLSELFIRQIGRRVLIETPGGAVFSGRRLPKGTGRFRVRARLKEGGLRRRLKIRGRLIDPYTIRVVSIERVFSGGQKVCAFKHRGTMIRFWS